MCDRDPALQTMSVECPPGVVAGHVEQSLSIFTPTYIIKVSRSQRPALEVEIRLRGTFQNIRRNRLLRIYLAKTGLSLKLIMNG